MSFNDRVLIRQQIQLIVAQRLYHTGVQGRLKQRLILRQSFGFENFLHKRALCMEQYSDLNTLEDRVMKVANAIMLQHHGRIII